MAIPIEEYNVMTEKKTIVIKVKYPVYGVKVGGELPNPKVVTEWNLKRIAAALFGFFLIISGVFYGFNHYFSQSYLASLPINSGSTIIDKSIPSQPSINQYTENKVASEVANIMLMPSEAKESKVDKFKVIKNKEIVTSKKIELRQSKQKKSNNNVTRALITNQVFDKEPGSEISRKIILNNSPALIYYFTELKGMSGQKVYHEWSKNDKLISKYELNIESTTWRTSSRKLISNTDYGEWTVRLIDQTGHVLNEKKFKAK
jgi:hypothetical protein